MIGTNVVLALSALARNRLRSTLTVLGIGIGIATMICTAALGTGGTARLEAQMAAIGDDFLWIRPGSRNVGGVRTGYGGYNSLKIQDATALMGVPEIEACSPVVQGREQIIVGNSNWNTRYQGVFPSYFQIRKRTVAAGTLFTDADLATSERVLVLGLSVSQQLFGEENPVGRTVRMGRFPYKIIGVLAPRGVARGGVDRDDVVFVPLTTSKRNLDRRDSVSDIMCGVRTPESMTIAETQAAQVMRIRHRLEPGEPDDFQIQKPLEQLEMRARTAETMASMLALVSAVSLVVGGVGIMNIMLVSVTERRREIGVRLAIGARVRDIRWQFLLEAATIGLVGGACGVAIGWLASGAFAAGLDWPMVISPEVVVFATLSAMGAGLVFGYFPAHMASMLDPIDAIRLDN